MPSLAVWRRAVCCLALVLAASPARAEKPYAFLFGMNHSELSGALGDGAQNPRWSAILGVSYRIAVPAGMRMRTGVEYVTRGGQGGGPLEITYIIPEWGSGGSSFFTLDLGQGWESRWFVVPVTLERSFGSRRWRPYVSAGAAPAFHWRPRGADTGAFGVSPDTRVRSVDVEARGSLGVEFHDRGSIARFELRANGGLLPLLTADGAPSGQAWGIAAVIELSP